MFDIFLPNKTDFQRMFTHVVRLYMTTLCKNSLFWGEAWRITVFHLVGRDSTLSVEHQKSLNSSFQSPKTNGWNPPKLVVCRCFHLFQKRGYFQVPSVSVSEVMLAEEKETYFEDLDASTDAGSELPELLGWNYLKSISFKYWREATIPIETEVGWDSLRALLFHITRADKEWTCGRVCIPISLEMKRSHLLSIFQDSEISGQSGSDPKVKFWIPNPSVFGSL